MKTINLVKSIILLMLVLFMASGCTSMQTLSSYARTGDTVVIAVGGSEMHVTTDMLKVEDLTVTLTDSAGVTHPVKVRNLFRAYPDPTSFYNHTGWDISDTYQSQWTAVLDLVNPADSTPLPLAIGNATIAISAPNLQNHHMWNLTWSNGYLESIPIEIIAGQGTRNPLNYMDPLGRETLWHVEPMSQVMVSPSREIPSTEGVYVAGGEFVFTYPTTLLRNAEINVATITPDKKTQMAVRFLPQPDDTTILRVIIMNPNGFSPSDYDVVTFANSPYKGLKFALYWANIPELSDATWQNHVQLVSAQYIDVQGNVIPDLSAVLTKVK